MGKDVKHSKSGKRGVPHLELSTKRAGRPVGPCLSARLRQVLSWPANTVEVARKYCDAIGADSAGMTVMDAIVHCQLHWAFNGSAPHMNQIWERIEGKVPQKNEVTVDGKLGVSEAIAAMHVVGSRGKTG